MMTMRDDLTEPECWLLDQMLYEEAVPQTPEEEAELEAIEDIPFIPADDPGMRQLELARDGLAGRRLVVIGPEGVYVLTPEGRALARLDPQVRAGLS